MRTPSGRPTSFEERYRLYIDESGDHVFGHLTEPNHRYLCLLGCWVRGLEYRRLHRMMEDLKQRHIPHNPDEPVILHREDIVNRRRCFWRLRNPEVTEEFDRALIALLGEAQYTVVAIVIDKLRLQENYETPAHPYHLAMGFLLQRYCGYLNHVNRVGDVMAESRGGRENRLLVDSFERVYERGAWRIRAPFFQQALTSRRLKIEQKRANIAGLQLADLIAHTARKAILVEKGRSQQALSLFETRLMAAIERKFNRHLYDGRVEGYGKVLFPK